MVCSDIEAKFIQKIVEKIPKCTPVFVGERLVGVKPRAKAVESLLSIELNEYTPDSDLPTSTTERVLYFPVSTFVYCSNRSTQFIPKSRLTKQTYSIFIYKWQTMNENKIQATKSSIRI